MLITSGVLRVNLRRSVTVNVVIGAAEWKSEGGWVELGRSFPRPDPNLSRFFTPRLLSRRLLYCFMFTF